MVSNDVTHSYGDSCIHNCEFIKDIMNWEQQNKDDGGNKKSHVTNIIVTNYKLEMINQFYTL